jgi:hypothetical protein
MFSGCASEYSVQNYLATPLGRDSDQATWRNQFKYHLFELRGTTFVPRMLFVSDVGQDEEDEDEDQHSTCGCDDCSTWGPFDCVRTSIFGQP